MSKLSDEVPDPQALPANGHETSPDLSTEADWWFQFGREFCHLLATDPRPYPPQRRLPPREPTDFDRTYRDLVLPELARRAQRYGEVVGLGYVRFSDAYDWLFNLAYARGAAHLADPHSLEDYLAELLIEAAS